MKSKEERIREIEEAAQDAITELYATQPDDLETAWQREAILTAAQIQIDAILALVGFTNIHIASNNDGIIRAVFAIAGRTARGTRSTPTPDRTARCSSRAT